MNQEINPSRSLLYFAAGAGLLFAAFFCVGLPRALTFVPGLYALLTLVGLWAVTRSKPVWDKTLAMFLAALLLLSCLSALWAYDPAEAVERAFKSAAVLFGGYLIFCLAPYAAKVPAKNIWAIVAALLCGIGGIFIWNEYTNDFPVSRILLNVDPNNPPKSIQNGFLINRNTVYLVLLSAPCLLAVYLSSLSNTKKCLLAVFALAGIGMALSATQSQTSQIAAVFLMLGLLYPARSAIARKILLAAVVVTMWAAPVIPAYIYQNYLSDQKTVDKNSWYWQASIPQRMEVWNFISTEIFKKPVLGHGIDATPHLRSETAMPFLKADTILHPHNAVLQIWLEFGVPGMVLSTLFMIFLFRRLETQAPFLQHYYTAVFISMMGVLCMGYGFWQSWQLGMIMAIPGFSAMATNHYLRR